MISNQFKKCSFIILQIKDKKVPMEKILLEYHLVSATNFQFSFPTSKDLIINSPINFLVLNRIDPSLLWKPDLFLYNSASESFDATFPVNMVVSSNGRISQIPPGIFKSTCLVSFFLVINALFQVLLFFSDDLKLFYMAIPRSIYNNGFLKVFFSQKETILQLLGIINVRKQTVQNPYSHI